MLRLAAANSRGVVSKITSIHNILAEQDIDCFLVTETLLKDSKRPRIPNYFSVVRNRVGRTGGGVAMLIHDRFKNHVVVEEKGEDDCEFVAVTFTCYEPRVSVVLYYGQQENTAGRELVCKHLAAVLGAAEKLHLDGNTVYLAGDFNVHLGALAFPNSNVKVSSGGQALLTMLEETDLQIINGMNRSGGNGHTHYDRTAGSSNVLDLVLTNKPNTVEWLEVDEKFERTPYRWKGGNQKNYSDHCAVYWTVRCEVKQNSGFGPMPKYTRWRHGKPGGHELYKEYLESKFIEMQTTVVSEPDINTAVENLYRVVKKGKHFGYGQTTITAKKLKRVEEEKEWRRRVLEIDQYVADIEAKYSRPMTRVWSARKSVLLEGRYAEEAAVKNHWTGEMLREKEEICDFSLEFNQKVLEKSDPPGMWKEIREAKIRETKLAMALENVESRTPITNMEFNQALAEIAESNKDVYQDLNRSGPMFQQVVKDLVQRIWKEGKIPDSFKETTLMKLHKKGPKNVIDNYRWLHLKTWLPKFTEKVVMLKLKERMVAGTPEFQLGGQPMGSCAEHLVAVNTVLNARMREGKATVIHLYDIRKCFDQTNLWDVAWEASQCNIWGRDLRFLMNINQDIRMKICGDTREGAHFVAKDTLGQGMVSACMGSALTIARVIDRRFRCKGDKIRVGDVLVDPSGFVDDMLSMDGDAKSGKDSCARVSDGFDELALKAHPTKSVRIVVGKATERAKVESDNDADPETIQGFPVKAAVSDMYLGHLVHQDGPRASCTANIDIKRTKCAVKTQLIIRMLKEERVRHLGWMRAAIGLLQGIVLQVLVYGTEAFIDMTKTQVKQLEKIWKDSVYAVLELSKFANYAAVMYETGLLPVEDVIKMKKLNFINKLVHIKGTGQCLRLLQTTNFQNPGKGLLAEVSRYSAQYELPDVGVHYCEKRVIDRTVKEAVSTRLWLETLVSSKTFKHWTPEKTSNRPYFLRSKLEAKLMLGLRIGELNFKLSRKTESIRRFGGLECWVKVCLGTDGPMHVAECFGYSARIKPGHSEDELVDYLVELHKERLKKFGQPLVYLKP